MPADYGTDTSIVVSKALTIHTSANPISHTEGRPFLNNIRPQEIYVYLKNAKKFECSPKKKIQGFFKKKCYFEVAKNIRFLYIINFKERNKIHGVKIY